MQHDRARIHHCDVAIIGAGIVGISVAYYLKKIKPSANVVLLDSEPPMSFTSAQSGENYRNWWPHPVMTAFTDHSIDLMEALSRESENHFHMNRRGYVLATRAGNTDALMQELKQGYAELQGNRIRVHDSPSSNVYDRPTSGDWESAPSGVDVLLNSELIANVFPSYDTTIKSIVHIRRAGAISAQQMGQLMLREFKDAGGLLINTSVVEIETNNGFVMRGDHSPTQVHAEQLVNAAGPYINHIAAMLGEQLPVCNTLQQKIAFEDVVGVIPRDMPFSIDLDGQTIDWTDEERQLLSENDEHQWLLQPMPGAIHCRPDGGDNGRWVKLGWAFNNALTDVTRTPTLLNEFPEIVLRGAARLNPGLKTYYDRLPRSVHHYGGYYTLTDENWPLIGPMQTAGAHIVGAMSGFGTMAACAAGDLAARWVLEVDRPAFAPALTLGRYANSALMNEISALSQRGIL